MSPHYNKLAEENAVEGVEFYKVNTDDVPDLASEFSIRSVGVFPPFSPSLLVSTFPPTDTHILRIQERKVCRQSRWGQPRPVDGVSCVRSIIHRFTDFHRFPSNPGFGSESIVVW